MTMTIEQWRTRADNAETERDKYKNACICAGVCMSCVLGLPEPYGCTDCLNTGWDQGAPYEAREALAEIARLQAENFALAANQCHDGYSDEGGSHRCKEVDNANKVNRRNHATWFVRTLVLVVTLPIIVFMLLW
jgi:hypothetical protein